MAGSDIKERLEVYRRRRQREEMTESIKNAIKTVLPWNKIKSTEDSSVAAPLVPDVKDNQDVESTCSDDSVEQSQYTVLKIITHLLYFLLWGTLYIIAIEYEFGTVYFILSTLLFMCLNTRSRPKRSGELSAYSVFNPNCRAIEGTLDASQFEREIRYGMGSVH
ncbi:SAYSvFN domain-containing protein 1 [Melipona quadrifasciata]|uniref:SAYSvFN domain-containing protein 1 n=1 Tax=Melipona quadrifasciata TaxID=166423 RepID=A0A0M8ZTV8_9HYME|nr:SAYSvFN domain-containing protein 1 [Melipona quadrifasciata]